MADEGYTVAVYGAPGALGREILLALEGEDLPVDRLLPVGAAGSAGTEVPWHGQPHKVLNPAEVDPGRPDVAILATPPDAADELREPLRSAGTFVADATPHGHIRGGLPVAWPGRREAELERHPGGIAVPCAPASALAALVEALRTRAPVAGIEATVLLGASASGRSGEEALSRQTIALLNQGVPEPEPFGGVLAFNALPGSAEAEARHDPFEARTAAELAAVVGAPPEADDVRLTAIQIPIFVGTGLAATVRFDGEPPEQAELTRAIDDDADLLPFGDRPSIREAQGREEVLVGPLRREPDGALRTFLAVDGLQRSAEAVARLLARLEADELW